MFDLVSEVKVIQTAIDLRIEVSPESPVAVLQGCVYPSSDSRHPVFHHAL